MAEHQETIATNRDWLVTNIDVMKTSLLDALIPCKVISTEQLISIKDTCSANIQRVSALLDILHGKSKEEWDRFINCLVATNSHQHVVERLKVPTTGETGVVDLEINFDKLNINDLIKELVEAQKTCAKRVRMNAEQSMSGETVDMAQCRDMLHLIKEIETTKRRILSVEYKCIVIRVKCVDVEALMDLQNKITSGLLHQLLVKDIKKLGLLEKYSVPEDDLDKINISIPCEQHDKALAALTAGTENIDLPRVKSIKGKVAKAFLQKFDKIRFWTTKAPWTLTGDQIYTPMSWVKQSREPTGLVKKPLQDYHQFLLNEEEEPLHIVVTGEAGRGKSTFCHRLAVNWAQSIKQPDRLDKNLKQALQKFDFVIPLVLREAEEATTLETFLKKQLMFLGKETAEYLVTYFRSCPDRFLLLFDGLDEVKEKKIQELYNIVTKIDLSLPLNIIVTCREHAADGEWVPVNKILLEGFNQQNISQYITKFYKSNKKIADTLQDEIDSSEAVTEMATSPVLLQLICILWQNNVHNLENKGSLYLEFIKIILDRYSVEKLKEKCPSDSLLDKFGGLIRKIGHVCMLKLKDNEYTGMFESEDICRLVGEEVFQLGLFDVIPADNPYKSSTVQFAHLTIGEFCVALAIYLGEDEVSQVLIETCDNLEGIARMRTTLEFLPGLDHKIANTILQEIWKRFKPSASYIKYLADSLENVHLSLLSQFKEKTLANFDIPFLIIDDERVFERCSSKLLEFGKVIKPKMIVLGRNSLTKDSFRFPDFKVYPRGPLYQEDKTLFTAFFKGLDESVIKTGDVIWLHMSSMSKEWDDEEKQQFSDMLAKMTDLWFLDFDVPVSFTEILSPAKKKNPQSLHQLYALSCLYPNVWECLEHLPSVRELKTCGNMAYRNGQYFLPFDPQYYARTSPSLHTYSNLGKQIPSLLVLHMVKCFKVTIEWLSQTLEFLPRVKRLYINPECSEVVKMPGNEKIPPEFSESVVTSDDLKPLQDKFPKIEIIWISGRE